MKTLMVFVLAAALLVVATAFAQHGNEHPQAGGREGMQEGARAEMQHPGGGVHDNPRANQGHVPEAPRQREPNVRPEEDRRGNRVNSMPHVNNNRWYGHDERGDRRYHEDRPFEHGRFERFGPTYRYRVLRVDPGLHRFWIPGGYFFEVADWDWPIAADWCWTCDGDDFVVYEDPDHPGWYLLYNLYTGEYVHVLYMGM